MVVSKRPNKIFQPKRQITLSKSGTAETYLEVRGQRSMQLLPGTEVYARGLRLEVVSSESLGPQTLYRLRGLENAVMGHEIDMLYPFESIEPVRHELRPDRAAPLINWLVYHQAFLLEQALGPGALLAVQPGRLRIEPYQLVPVLRAIRMSRVRLLLADGVGLGKTIQAGLGSPN